MSAKINRMLTEFINVSSKGFDLFDRVVLIDVFPNDVTGCCSSFSLLMICFQISQMKSQTKPCLRSPARCSWCELAVTCVRSSNRRPTLNSIPTVVTAAPCTASTTAWPPITVSPPLLHSAKLTPPLNRPGCHLQWRACTRKLCCKAANNPKTLTLPWTRNI